MEGLYENKTHIFIVMEKLSGGELFERIGTSDLCSSFYSNFVVGRPRFTEVEAAKLLKPLLESVAYLHDLGIVHRDLKPENILCGDNLEDLKIADFGLSKMVLPKEKMDVACGTLSYVAPEVLTMAGYGKEADLWSVGVIMFLLMCGKLPFDGNDQNEIIKNTIQVRTTSCGCVFLVIFKAELKVNLTLWNKLDDDAKSLITSLLARNPKDRITARDALKHKFIQRCVPRKACPFCQLRDRFYPHKKPPSSTAITEKPDPVAAPSSASSNQTSPPPMENKLAGISEPAALQKGGAESPMVHSNEQFSRPV